MHCLMRRERAAEAREGSSAADCAALITSVPRRFLGPLGPWCDGI